MTEQEKYYIRKNKQAQDIDETLQLLGPIALLFVFGWLLIYIWPIVLFCIIVYVIGYLLKYTKTIIVDMYTTLYNFLFRRKQIKTDTLNLLDSLAILIIMFFGIVIAISITLN